jgi:hypothetical protein
VTSVDPLESGEHTITLSYRMIDDAPHRTPASRALPSASVRVVVARTKAVPANAWPAWNPFGDA